jgi:hypothetical protein
VNSTSFRPATQYGPNPTLTLLRKSVVLVPIKPPPRMDGGTRVVAPEDDQCNEHHRGNRVFSSYRVPHQRHKRLVANSPWLSGAGGDPFAEGPSLPRLRPAGRLREFATSGNTRVTKGKLEGLHFAEWGFCEIEAATLRLVSRVLG